MPSKPKPARPVLLAVVSDLHCGSTVAVCPPEVQLDDGGHYAASKAQRWLWACWLDYWRQVDERRRALGADLFALFNGDMVDGDHHNTSQILSRNPNAQAAVVTACMAVPLALKPDALFFVRGTDVHVGQSACAEERIADGLRRDKRPVQGDDVRGTASRFHLRMEIQGVRIEAAHHGRVGSRPWTKPNVTANLAASIFYKHAAKGIAHPHLSIRSHMHQLVDTHDQHPVRVIQTAAWQLATSFIHRLDPSPPELADVGGLIVTIENGAYDVRKVEYHPEAEEPWRPTS